MCTVFKSQSPWTELNYTDPNQCQWKLENVEFLHYKKKFKK
jgi:hypothetical protein